MSIRFLQNDLWKEITALAKKPGRRSVAVAYIGSGAARLLPLKRGDILVTDLRLNTVRAGQVNPFELEKYLRRGVRVFSHAYLHAKVFVLAGKVIVGSMNLSKSSAERLIESAVLVSDKKVVNWARGFVKSISGEPISLKYLKVFQAEYKPPRVEEVIKNRKLLADRSPRVWVTRINPVEFDAKEEALFVKRKQIAAKKTINKRKYTITGLSFGYKLGIAKSASFGDLVIQIYPDDNGRLLVYPPSRVLDLNSYVGGRSSERKMILIEELRNPSCLQWKEFKLSLKKVGLRNLAETMIREITSQDAKQSILGLWVD